MEPTLRRLNFTFLQKDESSFSKGETYVENFELVMGKYVHTFLNLHSNNSVTLLFALNIIVTPKTQLIHDRYSLNLTIFQNKEQQ